MKSLNKGFTLVELIVVIGILSILTVIAVPKFISYKDKAKEQVCNINCKQLEKAYNIYLVSEDFGHTDQIFQSFMREFGNILCPVNGNISYDNGQVRCDIHSNKNEDGEVPYI